MRTCDGCGATMPPQGRRGEFGDYCGKDECRRARNRIRMRAFNARKKAELGEPYYRRFRAQQAETRRAQPHWRQRYPEQAADVDARRRALEYGVEAESFARLEVFERDGWVCGICLDPVDRDLAYPDPMSPSLDHVIPLSLGGPHTRANTRCSHLRCNVLRGAVRYDGEHRDRGGLGTVT